MILCLMHKRYVYTYRCYDCGLSRPGGRQFAALIACCSFLSLLQEVGCHPCKIYRKTLFSLLSHYRSRKRKHSDGTSPSSHTNYRFLSTPEKIKRLRHLHRLHHNDQQRITRLRTALDGAIEERGVTVDYDLHQDLRGIVKNNTDFISSTYPPGSFARLFWDSQQHVSAVSTSSSMRWDPLVRLFATLVRFSI